MTYCTQRLPEASPPPHPRGSVDVRLLEALVNAVLDHGSWCEAARADFLSAIRREEARALTEEEIIGQWDRDGSWRPGLAGLTAQEAQVIRLKGELWENWDIAKAIGRRQQSVAIRTVDQVAWRARTKLRRLPDLLTSLNALSRDVVDFA